MFLPLLLALTLQQPALEHRWIYLMTNLQVAKNADTVCDLIVRAKKAGYNGLVIADTKFQRLGNVPEFYITNARKVMDTAKANGVELIPCVWPVGYASAMLGHDVNLIEGLPVRGAPFVVRNGEARPEAGDANLLPNGSLEGANGDKIAGLTFQDGAGASSFVDASEKHEGGQSVRLENFAKGNEAGNARLVWTLKVQPYHQFLLSGWTRREGLKGLVQAIALDAKGQDLVVNDISSASTEPWSEFRYSFNSLGNDEIKVYLGVWGGSAGRIWWDDVAVRDAGLLNVLRRPGCPLKAVTSDGSVLVEGKDFQTVSDPGLGVKPWAGEYDVEHAAPVIKLLPGSRAKEGDRLAVSFYHAKTGIGNQTAICLSEPKTIEILTEEARRVIELFHPKALFWSHDEIRVGGWCEACQSRKLTPGQILADNARTCDRIQQKLLPGSATYVWSDMFDPSHNAHADYYLTNGSLAGSWEGLPKNAVIVNWNSGGRSSSLPFFAGRGHPQILAGYYDGPVDDIKGWLAEAAKNRGSNGVLYTTWVGNYADLEAFAKAAWGARLLK